MSKNLKYHRLVRFQSMCICKYMMRILCGILVRYSAISVNDAQRKYIWTWALFLPWLSYVWMLCVGVLPNMLIGFAGWTSWLCVRYIYRIGSHTDCLYSISNLFEFHLLHSTTRYVHSYVHFRQSSNVMELLQQTFIASENWHFAEEENYFRYQGHQYANRRICFFQYTVVLSDNLLLLLLFLWAEPFLLNNIFILFLPFRNFIVSILRCYVLLTTALRFSLSLSPWNRNFSANIFPSKCSMYLSCFFASMLTQKLGIILHLISISSLEVAEVLLIRPIQLTFYHAYRQKSGISAFAINQPAEKKMILATSKQ